MLYNTRLHTPVYLYYVVSQPEFTSFKTAFNRLYSTLLLEIRIIAFDPILQTNTKDVTKTNYTIGKAKPFIFIRSTDNCE